MKNIKIIACIVLVIVIIAGIVIMGKNTNSIIENGIQTTEPDLADRGNYPSVDNPVVMSPESIVKENLKISTEEGEAALDTYSDFYYDPMMKDYVKYLGMEVPSSLSVINSSGQIINVGNSTKPVILAFTNKDDTFFSNANNKFEDFDKFSKEYDNYTFSIINLNDDETADFFKKLPFGYVLNSPTKESVDFLSSIDAPCILYVKDNKIILSSYPAIATSVSNVALNIFKEPLDGKTVFSELDIANKDITSTRITGLANPRVPSTLNDAEKILGFKPIVPKAFKDGEISVISEKVFNIDKNDQTFRASKYFDITGDYNEYSNYNSALNDDNFTISMHGYSKTEFNLIKWTTGEVYYSIFSEKALTEDEVMEIVK